MDGFKYNLLQIPEFFCRAANPKSSRSCVRDSAISLAVKSRKVAFMDCDELSSVRYPIQFPVRLLSKPRLGTNRVCRLQWLGIQKNAIQWQTPDHATGAPVDR